jgi:hypothetical protein
MATQLLDSLSIGAIIALFAVLSLACYEIGFRVGRWWQERMPGEQEGPTGVLVGALLGLFAFLLAVTMGLAADRFDARRGLVLAEANAIGEAYLQADYLPQPAADEMKDLLREYVSLRIASDDLAQVQASIQRSVELHAAMWTITAEVAQSGHSPDLVSSSGCMPASPKRSCCCSSSAQGCRSAWSATGRASPDAGASSAPSC